jgi:hypothetical protein
MSKKWFTVEEAEKLIPKLEDILEGLLEHKRNAIEVGQELASLQEQVQSGKETNVEASDLINKQTELDFLVKVMNEGVEAIEELGAHPKDLDLGLVDFPTMLEGEEVLLCWKYGEKSIRFYHGVTAGFAGRKPLR